MKLDHVRRGASRTAVAALILAIVALAGVAGAFYTFATQFTVSPNCKPLSGDVSCLKVSWSQLTDFPGTCGPDQYIITLSTSLVCASVGQTVSGGGGGGGSGSGTITFANSTTIGVTSSGTTYYFHVISVPFSLLTDIPTACPSSPQEYVTSITPTALECSLVAWGSLTAFPPGCSSGEYVTAVNTTLTCASVAWDQLSGFPDACPDGEFVIQVAASITCGTPSIPSLNDQCPTNEFVYNITSDGGVKCGTVVTSMSQGSHTITGGLTLVNSSTIGVEISGQDIYFKVSAVPYADITGFPSGCSANEFVTSIGSSLGCSAVSYTGLTNFPAACSTGEYVTQVAATPVCAQVQLSQLGGSSSCPDSPQEYVITVGSSVTCATPVDSLSQGSETVTGEVTFVNTTTIGVDIKGNDVYFNIDSVPYSDIDDFPAGCTTNQFVTAIGSSLTCSQVSYTGLSNYPTACSSPDYVTAVGATLTCTAAVSEIVQGSDTPLTGTVTFLNSSSIGVSTASGDVVIKVTSTPWSSITGFPSGCSTGEFVTSVGSSLSCSSVAWSAITSFPSSCASNTYVTAVGTTLTCTNAVSSLTQGSHTIYGAVSFVNSSTIGVDVSGNNVYFKITAVPWSLITSFPSACSSGDFVSGVGTTLTCSAPSWTSITNFPTACSSNQYVTAVGATLTCSSVSYTGLTNFPSSCPSFPEQFVTQVAASPTCAIPAQSNNNSTALIAYWPLDEGTGTSAYDLTDDGYTGTLSGSPLPVWSTSGCEFNGCLDFAGGASSDYVSTPLAPTNSGTVSIWASAESASDNIVPFGSKGTNGYLLFDNGNGGTNWRAVIKVGSNSEVDLTDTGTITEGKMYNLVMSWNSGTQTIAFYVDGTLIANSSYTGTITSEITTDWYIGAAASGHNYWDGYVDDVRVYNNYLRASYVEQIYQSTPPSFENNEKSLLDVSCPSNEYVNSITLVPSCGSISYTGLTNFPSACPSYPEQYVTDIAATPICALPPDPNNATALVAYWPVTEGSGSYTYDLTDSGHTGTLTNSPSWTSSCLWGTPCLAFTGSSDEYVTVPSAATLSPEAGASGELTLSAWIKVTSTSATGAVVSKGSASNYEYELYLDGSGDAWLKIYNAAGSSDICNVGSVALTANTWELITGTYVAGATNGCKMYLNGVLSSQATPVGTATAGSAAVEIGARADSSQYFTGDIKDVRIYSVALGSSYVAQLYQSVPLAFETEQQSLLTTTCATGDFINSITVVPACSAVSFTNLTNLPSACSSGEYVSAITASSLTCSDIPWTSITSYPTSCSAGDFVTGVTTTLDCAAAGSVSSFTTSCGAGSAVNTVTASNTVVTGGCAAVSGFISSAATVSCASQSFVTTQGTATAVCGQVETQIGPETTSQVFTSTSTWQTIISASVTASTEYAVEAYIPFSCSDAGSGSIFLGVAAPAGATFTLTSASPVAGDQISATSTTTGSASVPGASCTTGTWSAYLITGYISVSSTGGTLSFISEGFRSSTANPTVTFSAGAWIQLSNPAG